MTIRSKRPFVGICTLDLYLPESLSLKDKRSAVKSLSKRLRNTHNIAVAEIDALDNRQRAVIAFTTLSNSHRQTEQMVTSIIEWIEQNYPQAQITSEDIEIL